MRKTDVMEFLNSLEGGVLVEALGNIISDVGFATRNVDSRVKGKIVLTLNFDKLNDNQLMIDHKVEFKRPTSKGSISEDRTSQTPMYVNRGGELSLLSKDQDDIFAPKVVPLHKEAN